MGAVPPTAPQNGPARGRVLVVDDDAALAEMLGIVLRREGYEPAFVSDGNRAMGVFQQTRPDLVLLDLMLPGRNGLQICQDIRTQSTVPIVMLTAKGDTIDVVQGLEAGADDYVTKPFGLAELRSRIRAVLRRAHGRVVDGVRSVGSVTIDQRERQVTVGGAPVRLTFSEYELLACLMERPGKLFTRQELLRAIWGDSAYRDPRAIDVHIRHLREKLEERPEDPSLILTVRGAGYRFRER